MQKEAVEHFNNNARLFYKLKTGYSAEECFLFSFQSPQSYSTLETTFAFGIMRWNSVFSHD